MTNALACQSSKDHMENNGAFRALFTLPPVQMSSGTALTVPETPAPKTVTGDRELDAILWLRDCIKTGHQTLIAPALEAFKRVKTPAKALEDRYCEWLRVTNANNPFAAIFGGYGFADLEALAKSSIEKRARRDEAMARFGTKEELFKLTPAEDICKKALRGLKRSKDWGEYDAEAAAERFAKRPVLVPHTLADCLHQQNYWDSLYWLRNEIDMYASDADPAARAHDDYCFAMLAKIAPRSKDEALQVYQHLEEKDGLDRNETPDIMRNLIAGGWQ